MEKQRAKRHSIAVGRRTGLPPMIFLCDALGVPYLPVSLEAGVFGAARRGGMVKAQATGVALVQASCLALALPHLPSNFSLKQLAAPVKPKRLPPRAMAYVRQRTSRLLLTDQCLAHLGLLLATGDPNAKIGARSDGFSRSNFGRVDCSNLQAAVEGKYFHTTDQHYVRNGVRDEVEKLYFSQKVQIFSMTGFVQKVLGARKAGEMIMPCHLPDPAATISFLTKRDFAVDPSAEAEAALPAETKIHVDVDLAVFLLRGPDSAWASYKLGQLALPPAAVAPPPSAFAQKVKACCAPLAQRLFADAHRTAATPDTAYHHAVDSFSAATSAADWGTVPKDALEAASFVLSRCPKHWRDDQCRMNDSFREFVRYDSKGPFKFEHCRSAFLDADEWTVLAGIADHVSEPVQVLVRAPVHFVREAAVDILAAMKIVNESPSDCAKLRASRSAPAGTFVTVRGNSKLFLLSILLLVMERCETQFGVDLTAGKVIGAVQVHLSLLFPYIFYV